MTKKKVISYIDGFSLYYSILKTNPHLKWLDLRKLCNSFLDQEVYELSSVKYFTSNVINLDGDPIPQRRQNLYNRALAMNGVEIIKGVMKKRSDYKRLTDDPTQKVRVDFLEEKHTDANIACHMVYDASIHAFDKALLFTNDSDHKTPIDFVCQKQGKDVELIWCSTNPQGNVNKSLRDSATRCRRLKESRLLTNQLPKEVAPGVFRPKAWSYEVSRNTKATRRS